VKNGGFREMKEALGFRVEQREGRGVRVWSREREEALGFGFQTESKF